jgi:hypothetical protein
MIQKIGYFIIGFLVGRYTINIDIDLIKFSKKYINYEKIIKEKNKFIDDFYKEINKK